MTFKPEIKNDAFYTDIVETTWRIRPGTIVEIGSANGLGSTQAFLEGMKGLTCSMFCFEIDDERYAELVQNVAQYKNVLPIKRAPVARRMQELEIRDFLKEHENMNPAQYGIDTVLEWAREIDNKLTQPLAASDGLSRIDTLIRHPAIALVDGSPFSGYFETVWLAEELFDVIMLDDVLDIKCWDAYQYLKDIGYTLIKENMKLRNGYAIFERK